jgi:UV DNA damage repair endonuclease
VIDSWRGVRPVIHYSVSREDLLDRHAKGKKPNMKSLLEQGFKKAKLRAHSDYMWNRAVNDWALEFLDYADIMVESKAKNLASIALYKDLQKRKGKINANYANLSNTCVY